MDVWIWVALGGAVAAVWWKRGAHRVFVINHVRVEMHPPCIVEDRVIEQVWRAAISMTNTSRRPRALPTFAERATVRAGRREYLVTPFLEADVNEANPGEVALAWAEVVLPASVLPVVVVTTLLEEGRGSRPVRFALTQAVYLPSPSMVHGPVEG